jgi:leucyl aminopeptidase
MYGISKIICVVGLIKTIVAIPTEESRLLSLSPGQSKLITSNHLHFVDMTEGNWDYLDNNKYASLVAPAFPQNCTQQQIVLPLIANIDRSYILDFLGRFTSFKNRYYKSTYGAQSSQMLYDELLSISQAMGRTDIKLSVSKFAHNWGQFSVVAKLEAVNQIRGYENLVILGGHQDSINQNSPMEGIAPGVGINLVM